MLFIDAPESLEELDIIASRLNDVPLLVNMLEGGKTPTCEFDYLKERGFKIVLYPATSARIVMKALQEFALHLKEKGNTKELEPRMASFEMRNEILGLRELDQLLKQFTDF